MAKRKKTKRVPQLPEPLQLQGEIWRPINFGEEVHESVNMQISNFGRVKSFMTDKINGVILRPSLINKYPAISTKTKSWKTGNRQSRKSFYVHKIMAHTFLPKPSDEHTFVIHLNYKLEDNHVSNLKWATKKEKETHQFGGPNNRKSPNSKLSEGQVRIIKKKLADPNRSTRLKMIAKTFGISEMQLYRISSGENWGHVKI